MNIYVEGISDVQGMLKNFTSELTEKLSRGVAQGGKFVEGDARSLAPVDTGHLRRSIHAHTEGLRCEVGAGAHYAVYVCLGTYKMRAQPFLVPALVNNKENILQKIKENLK